MSTASLDTLLEKLANGESEAAERVFRNYEPFLRAMVRRRLTPPLRVSSTRWTSSSRSGLTFCKACVRRSGSSTTRTT